jgi:ABC-type branched-subunit amino acid transport system ATPase component
MTSAISAQGLSKSYGPVKAVVDVHLDVRRGEIYGFLGRNGAGKTGPAHLHSRPSSRARLMIRPPAIEISMASYL